MNIERAQFEPDTQTDADGRADADIRAGRVIDHPDVSAWLAKWGTPEEVASPPEWLE